MATLHLAWKIGNAARGSEKRIYGVEGGGKVPLSRINGTGWSRGLRERT